MKKYFLALLFSTQIFANGEPLVVGTTSGYAPYVSLDVNGNYEGFDIDFAQALAKKMERRLVIKDCGNMSCLLLALKQNKIDVILWAVSITEERMKKIEMIYYQGEKVTQMPFLFWKKIPEEIQSIDDLGKNPNYMISVEAGSFQEDVLKKYPKVRSKQVEKITDALMEIRFSKSTAAMADPSLIAKLTTQYPDIKILYLPLRPEEYSLGNGICVKKSNQPLANAIKVATEALIAEGKVGELEKKWNLGG